MEVFEQSTKRSLEDEATDVMRSSKRKARLHTMICEACSQINLEIVHEVLQSLHPVEPKGIWIANVGDRYRKKTEHCCDLGRILSTTRLASVGDGNDENQDELRIFPFLKYFSGINNDTLKSKSYIELYDSLFLQVVPSNWSAVYGSSYPWWKLYRQFTEHGSTHGYLICYAKGKEPPRCLSAQLVPSNFDTLRAQCWLRFCKNHHKNLCSKRPISDSSPVSKISLIDCETRKIDTYGLETEYVALSYVWGHSIFHDDSQRTSQSHAERLPSVIPKVIVDSIKVVLALGLRYLWVDKYCIDQSDKESKHLQIKNMDLIYESAELTIIAAAGVDETYGLPGVGDRPRTVQDALEISGIKFVSTMKHPDASISVSKWATRGWTFQEAVLSRRSLVFLDEQVYYECKSMSCYESLNYCMTRIHRNDKSKILDILRGGLFGRSTGQAFGKFDMARLSGPHVYWRFMSFIEQYSGRELTFDDDTFNAFAGVTKRFARYTNPVLHLAGIPFLPSQQLTFELGLSWYHTNTSRDGVTRARRRGLFPSWSWLGWAGQVVFPVDSDDTKIFFEPNFEVQGIRSYEGQYMDIKDALSSSHLSKLEAFEPAVLCIRARTIPSAEFAYDKKSRTWRVSGALATLALSESNLSEADISKELHQGDKLKCVFVGVNVLRTLILVLQMNQGYMTRAGIFYLHNIEIKLQNALVQKWGSLNEELSYFEIH